VLYLIDKRINTNKIININIMADTQVDLVEELLGENKVYNN